MDDDHEREREAALRDKPLAPGVYSPVDLKIAFGTGIVAIGGALGVVLNGPSVGSILLTLGCAGLSFWVCRGYVHNRRRERRSAP